MRSEGIFFIEQDVPRTFRDREAMRQWLHRVAKAQRKRLGTVTFVLLTDKALLAYNKQYLQHNDYTDVITFPAEGLPGVAGDVLMSRDRIKENARTFGVTLQEELHRVMVHGLLHLLGHTDKSAAQRAAMRKLEDRYLAAR